MKRKPVKTGGLAKKSRSVEMQGPAQQGLPGSKLHIRIRQIDGKQNIVVSHRRAQQERTQVADTDLEAGKMPAFLIKNPLFPPDRQIGYRRKDQIPRTCLYSAEHGCERHSAR